MDFYQLLLRSHNGLRWVVLVLMVLALVRALSGLFGRRGFSDADRKVALFAMVSLHLQLVLGLILYFMSPTVELALTDMGEAMKSKTLRFWAVEHMATMILGIILATIGYSRSKRASNDMSKFRRIAVFYGLGLLFILVSIPWPFRMEGIARGWF